MFFFRTSVRFLFLFLKLPLQCLRFFPTPLVLSDLFLSLALFSLQPLLVESLLDFSFSGKSSLLLVEFILHFFLHFFYSVSLSSHLLPLFFGHFFERLLLKLVLLCLKL